MYMRSSYNINKNNKNILRNRFYTKTKKEPVRKYAIIITNFPIGSFYLLDSHLL